MNLELIVVILHASIWRALIIRVWVSFLRIIAWEIHARIIGVTESPVAFVQINLAKHLQVAIALLEVLQLQFVLKGHTARVALPKLHAQKAKPARQARPALQRALLK